MKDNGLKYLLILLVVITIIGCLLAPLAFTNNTNVAIDESPDSLVAYSFNSQTEESPKDKSDFLLNVEIEKDIVEEKKVKAEVFRAVNGYYKDANRKEDITISVCSDGKRYLKPKPSYSSNNVELACQVKISSLKGYEYEIWYHEKGGDLKIYAFNEQDIK